MYTMKELNKRLEYWQDKVDNSEFDQGRVNAQIDKFIVWIKEKEQRITERKIPIKDYIDSAESLKVQLEKDSGYIRIITESDDRLARLKFDGKGPVNEIDPSSTKQFKILTDIGFSTVNGRTYWMEVGKHFYWVQMNESKIRKISVNGYLLPQIEINIR